MRNVLCHDQKIMWLFLDCFFLVPPSSSPDSTTFFKDQAVHSGHLSSFQKRSICTPAKSCVMILHFYPRCLQNSYLLLTLPNRPDMPCMLHRCQHQLKPLWVSHCKDLYCIQRILKPGKDASTQMVVVVNKRWTISINCVTIQEHAHVVVVVIFVSQTKQLCFSSDRHQQQTPWG